MPPKQRKKNCYENDATFNIFISLDELKIEVPTSVHNMYSRSNITNLVVGNGMLQQMPCDVLMHIDVSSTSGNSTADTSLSLVHGIVQKHHKCSHLSKFLLGCCHIPPYLARKFGMILLNQ